MMTPAQIAAARSVARAVKAAKREGLTFVVSDEFVVAVDAELWEVANGVVGVGPNQVLGEADEYVVIQAIEEINSHKVLCQYCNEIHDSRLACKEWRKIS
jgi:hypothetical protein